MEKIPQISAETMETNKLNKNIRANFVHLFFMLIFFPFSLNDFIFFIFLKKKTQIRLIQWTLQIID